MQLVVLVGGRLSESLHIVAFREVLGELLKTGSLWLCKQGIPCVNESTFLCMQKLL